ncbi:uncharacterized protein LOC105262259 [Musca domestica]|uniref:Uncharacterized protein LOC105262259 n=1 Tax=Musca domestica TaxID=7370 RepID=A0A9J7IBN2_MUSDO|nr:uncharacterized protein LOC105262259 [Musca domestica]
MFNNKTIFLIGVLLAISIGLSSSAGLCKGCKGKLLVKQLETLDSKRKCWLSMDNHVLLNFKLAVLKGVAGVLEDLYTKSNDLSRAECKTEPIAECEATADKDADIECITNRMKAMANAYVQLEECNGELLDRKDLNLMFKVMTGSAVGWRVVHPQC